MNTTHSAKAYYLHPDSAPYRQGIFDVIRIFVPDFAWSENADNTQTITVTCTENVWTLEIGADIIQIAVEGLDENQCRKKLKQALYRYFAAKKETNSTADSKC